MKKVAIVGTHGIGKTTLCKALADYAKAQGKKVSCIGEVVRECPYPINKEMCYKTCEWTGLEQILRERKAEREQLDLAVCDRSAYDPCIYFEETLNPNNLTVCEERTFYGLQSYLKYHCQTYDAIVLIKSSGEKIISDGVRDIGQEFQRKIEKLFMRDFGSRDGPVFRLGFVRPASKIIEAYQIFSDAQSISKEIFECLF
jgi:nicotinamide riboside kinase